jgi:hypothetical protein
MEASTGIEPVYTDLQKLHIVKHNINQHFKKQFDKVYNFVHKNFLGAVRDVCRTVYLIEVTSFRQCECGALIK